MMPSPSAGNMVFIMAGIAVIAAIVPVFIFAKLASLKKLINWHELECKTIMPVVPGTTTAPVPVPGTTAAPPPARF